MRLVRAVASDRGSRRALRPGDQDVKRVDVLVLRVNVRLTLQNRVGKNQNALTLVRIIHRAG